MAPALSAALASGCSVAAPRVAGAHLVFHLITDLALLPPGYRGVREPDASQPLLDLATAPGPLFVVLPGAAFDRHCARLGWGGGHYDRTLLRLRAARGDVTCVAAALAEQLVEQVPYEPHDQRIDGVAVDGPAGRTQPLLCGPALPAATLAETGPFVAETEEQK